MTATTLFDKIWAAHEVAPGPALHRPAPRPRGHQPAGLRRPAPGRPQGPPARPHARHRRPQRPHRRHAGRRAHPRRALAACRSRRSSATATEFGVPLYSIGSDRQGIVHVIGPELGVTQPGMTIVCGDSHTATHGAFGALAFGIGTSEVEHVLATQTLAQPKPKSMRDQLHRRARPRRHRQGPDPRHDRPDGHRRRRRPRGRVRRRGRSRALDGGPDDDLQHDDRGRRPRGHDRPRRHDVRVGRGPPAARRRTSTRRSPTGASCAPTTARRSTARSPSTPPRSRRWSPGARPRARSSRSPTPCPSRARDTDERALKYMGLEAGTPMQEITLDRVFIGSCTNTPHRRPARRRRGGQGPQGGQPTSTRWSCPAPSRCAAQAEAEGLDEVFRAAGFDWRTAGCSMCLGMNPDILEPGERCASTSNRNFEGRQGRGGRTHLVSPADGRRGRHRGPLRRHPGVGLMDPVKVDQRRRHRARPRRRRHRPDHPQAVPQAGRAHRLRRVPVLRLGARSPAGTCRRTRSSPPGRTSAAARAASTPRGRCRTTASRPSSPRRSPTSSSPTARRSGCCRCAPGGGGRAR